jgi:hypothetical protein
MRNPYGTYMGDFNQYASNSGSGSVYISSRNQSILRDLLIWRLTNSGDSGLLRLSNRREKKKAVVGLNCGS